MNFKYKQKRIENISVYQLIDAKTHKAIEYYTYLPYGMFISKINKKRKLIIDEHPTIFNKNSENYKYCPVAIENMPDFDKYWNYKGEKKKNVNISETVQLAFSALLLKEFMK